MTQRPILVLGVNTRSILLVGLGLKPARRTTHGDVWP